MKQSIYNIRWTIVFYSMVLALVLYQTGENSNGTIAALITMGLTIWKLYSDNDRLPSFFHSNIALLLTVTFFYLFLTQSLMDVKFSRLSKLCSQMLLVAMLCSFRITEREHKFLKLSYSAAMVVYAVLTIRSCLALGPNRYIHGDIYMFGSNFDPNYVGIPLVVGTVFLFHEILNNENIKMKAVSAVAYLIILIAIIETSSRGNSLSFVFSNALTFIFYFRDSRVRKSKYLKYFIILSIGLFIWLVFSQLQNLFGANIERMSTFEEGSDNGRFYLWEQSVNVFWEYPIFGAGLGSMVKLVGHASHNTYLQILCETGIIGAILFGTFFVKMIRKAWKYDKIIAVVIVSALFQITFLNSLDNRCIWALCGWIAMLPKNIPIPTIVHKN